MLKFQDPVIVPDPTTFKLTASYYKVKPANTNGTQVGGGTISPLRLQRNNSSYKGGEDLNNKILEMVFQVYRLPAGLLVGNF